MKKFFVKLKENFDSVFFLGQLAIALLVTVLTTYFDFPFIDRESLILYLLILIAFDLYFVAVYRIDLSGTLESFIRSASQTIFISGSTLVSLRISEGLLKEKLQSGISVKIIFWDLCNDTEAKALAEFDHSSCFSLANQIKGSLSLLWPIQREFPNLEIRFLKTVILTDYVGIDVDDLNGLIKVQSRFYKETSDKFANYLITVKDAPKIFRKYQEQIEKIWKDAVILDDAYMTKFKEKYGEV